METKVCTYTEPKIRLQLVRVFIDGSNSWYFEIRFNRKVVLRFTDEQALLARYHFSHYVQRIIVDRDATFLLNMTA